MANTLLIWWSVFDCEVNGSLSDEVDHTAIFASFKELITLLEFLLISVFQ